MNLKEYVYESSGEPDNYIVYDPDDEYEVIIDGLSEDEAATVANMLTSREAFSFEHDGSNYVLTDHNDCLRIIRESENDFHLLLAHLNR